MIQIIQPTRCNSFTSLLLDVYVWLNMFRASLRPSSGAYNCNGSLWFFCWREAAGALLFQLFESYDNARTSERQIVFTVSLHTSLLYKTLERVYIVVWSYWLHCLRRRSVAAWLLGLRVRIPAGYMDISILWDLCVAREKFLRRADQSSRGVLPIVACLSVIVKDR
jgi:hypothetical protein